LIAELPRRVHMTCTSTRGVSAMSGYCSGREARDASSGAGLLRRPKLQTWLRGVKRRDHWGARGCEVPAYAGDRLREKTASSRRFGTFRVGAVRLGAWRTLSILTSRARTVCR
jgi:hypothetical protein